MSNTLNNKQMDAAVDAAEADTQRVIHEQLRKPNRQPDSLPTEEEMLARISLLSDEIDANDEENRTMQGEIDTLYAKINAAKSAKS